MSEFGQCVFGCLIRVNANSGICAGFQSNSEVQMLWFYMLLCAFLIAPFAVDAGWAIAAPVTPNAPGDS